MFLSIANAMPQNIEAARTPDLIPAALQTNAATLLSLLEDYYAFMNTAGNPSKEIADIRNLKDIDLVSEKYLDQIQDLIGKSVPASSKLNKVELYKIIVKYYNSRGSEDSIFTFFKIFFDEFVSIFYPKDFLFNASSGKGSWESDLLFSNLEYDLPIRQIENTVPISIDGISFAANATNGSGQLISIRYFDEDEDAYDIAVDYYKGVTSITPGAKSRLIIDAVDIFADGNTYVLPESLYFSEFGVDGRPIYSEQLQFSEIPFVGSPTRVEWNGEKWVFTIGSPIGDMYAFFSDENVADPSLVTTWTPGWESTELPIVGQINDISFGKAINAQLYVALVQNAEFSSNVTVSVDILSEDWLNEYEVSEDRIYLTNDPLPTEDIPIGYYAVVNGRKIRPRVLGITSNVNGEFVWHQHLVETWIYEDSRSFLSDRYKIQDGYYWQDYSYVIRSTRDSSEWITPYKKFVHPSGLQLFAAIAIELIARNEWLNDIDYSLDAKDEDLKWLSVLIPPGRIYDDSIAFHTPRSQPGWLRDRVIRYLFAYLLPPDEELLRLLIINYSYLFGVFDVQTSYVRRRWQGCEKFKDPCKLKDGWLNKTIEDAEAEFSPTNACKIHNISIFVREQGIYEHSYYDDESGTGMGDWEPSSYNEDGGEGAGDWEASSYEIA